MRVFVVSPNMSGHIGFYLFNSKCFMSNFWSFWIKRSFHIHTKSKHYFRLGISFGKYCQSVFLSIWVVGLLLFVMTSGLKLTKQSELVFSTIYTFGCFDSSFVVPHCIINFEDIFWMLTWQRQSYLNNVHKSTTWKWNSKQKPFLVSKCVIVHSYAIFLGIYLVLSHLTLIEFIFKVKLCKTNHMITNWSLKTRLTAMEQE